MPTSITPKRTKGEAAAGRQNVNKRKIPSSGAALPNSATGKGEIRIRDASKAYEQAEAGSYEAMYDFLSCIYIEYIKAKEAGDLPHLLSRFGREKAKGSNARTHPIANLIRGALSEQMMQTVGRRRIGDWKTALCGMEAGGISPDDAKATLSTGGYVEWANLYRQHRAQGREKPKGPTTTRVKAFLPGSLKARAKQLAEEEKEVKATVRFQSDGTIIFVQLHPEE